MPDERGIEVTRGVLRESALKAPARLTAEDRALSLGDDASGGFAVPKQLATGKPVDLGYHDPVSSQAPYGFTGQPEHRDA